MSTVMPLGAFISSEYVEYNGSFKYYEGCVRSWKLSVKHGSKHDDR